MRKQFRKTKKPGAFGNKLKKTPVITDDEMNEIIFTCVIFVMMSGRIPEAFDDFHNYLTVVLPWLQVEDAITHVTNGERIGLSAQNVTDCATWLSNWTSGDTQNPKIYENNADKKKRNTESAEAYRSYEKDFNDWFHPLLDIISANPNATNDDKLKLNIKEKPGTHNRPVSKIAEIPQIIAEPAGAGTIKLKNMLPGDTSKPNLPEDANAVEITYACWGKEKPAAVELAGKIRESEPVNAEECTWRESHSMAVFNVDVSVQLSTFRIKGWARYIDAHNPTRAGTWSQPFNLIVP